MAATTNESETESHTPLSAILYVDHAKHLTPLTLAYHATASRHLTTGRSDVVPPSTISEVDTAFCPRCFACCDAASASLGFCRKDFDETGAVIGASGCKDCPICFSPVSISVDPLHSSPDANAGDDSNSSKTKKDLHLVCHYLCGYCKWSSQNCGVTTSADKLLDYPTSTDESKEKEAEKQRQIVIAETSKALAICLQQKIDEKNNECNDIFQSITQNLMKKEEDEERRRRMNISSAGSSSSRGKELIKGEVGWSLELLERSLLEKKKELESPWINYSGGVDSDPTIPTQPDLPLKQDPLSKQQQLIPTAEQVAAQMTITTCTPRFCSELFPLPVRYRARVSRRCLKEMSAGRPGILVKPKFNPLDGDTSLRAGHGQWWKKDSSAVHVVPRAQVCSHKADSKHQKLVALLKVRNPTLNMVRLRFSGPSSPNENNNSSSINESDENNKQSTFRLKELENVLIDPFHETCVQARMCPPGFVESLSPTEWIVLEHAEDPFLDVGRGQVEDPTEVTQWDATTILDSIGDMNVSKFRIVATRGDTAWIEMVLLTREGETEQEAVNNLYTAVPISMQIEVGNGSWEASLIKRRDLPEREVDMVTLDLVALLQ